VWEKSDVALIPAGRYLIAAGAACLILTAAVSLVRDRRLPKITLFIDKRVWSLGLVAIFFSDWLARPWGLFSGSSIRGEIIVGSFAMFALLRSGTWRTALTIWPLLVSALLLWSFFLAADGSLIFSDDHAMFIFRLNLLKQNFPSIPFWSPLWNAGFDARDFFATGALNVFFIAAPFIYLFPVESIYPALIASLLWIILPLSVYAAARIVGVERLGASIAATLAMCSGLFWYRWSLKYGTVGFITSTCLFPLVVALAIRHISTLRPSWSSSVLLAVITSLMLLWSPSGLAALPIAIVALPHLSRLLRSPRHLCTALLLVALNLPWMSMMWKVSKVGRFLDTSAVSAAPQHGESSFATQTNGPEPLTASDQNTFRHKAGGFSVKKTLAQWQNNATALNPLLLIFGLPALLSFAPIARKYFMAISAWLVLAGTVGVSLKPQLELDRMIVIASVLLTIPIGSSLVAFFSKASSGISWRIPASCAGSFVLIGPFVAASVVLNRSDDTYMFARPEVKSLVRTIEEHAGSGRVFFTGCVLHELSGGHLGPLPIWANKQMVATSYAHNIWKYEQPFPQSYLKRGDEGIKEYLDLMNASLVVAHEPFWIEYLQSRPSEYSPLWRDNHFLVFKRSVFTPSYALEGEIRDLSFTSNSITFTPQTERVVLKFKHFPFIKSSSCALQKYTRLADIELIQLSQCQPGVPVTIHSVSPLTRLLETPA
jgi:hypothetical protein